ISTGWVSPAMVMPLASVFLISASTHWSASPKAAIGPVCGLTMPILTVRPAAPADADSHGKAAALAPAAAISLIAWRRRRSTFTVRPAFAAADFVFMVGPSLDMVACHSLAIVFNSITAHCAWAEPVETGYSESRHATPSASEWEFVQGLVLSHRRARR